MPRSITSSALDTKPRPNPLYHSSSPKHMVLMSIVEQGYHKDLGSFFFVPKDAISWLGRLEKDLAGQVSRYTIYLALDSLCKEGMITPLSAIGTTIPIRVDENSRGLKYARVYELAKSPAKRAAALKLYAATHFLYDDI